MSAGTVVVERSFTPVTRTDFVKYAGAGGDFNPIHHDETFAVGAGYPSVFGQGLFTAGLAATTLAEAVGPLTLRRYGVRYVGQVWPGDALTVTVTEHEGTLQSRSLTLAVMATAQGQEPRLVLTGTAETTR